MLGFGVLGQFALGQVASPKAGDATAYGDTIVLNLSLIAGTAIAQGVTVPGALLALGLSLDAGAATGEQQPPIFILPGGSGRVYRRRHYDAVARGALITLDLSLIPGRAIGIITEPPAETPPAIDGTAAGAMIMLLTEIAAGGASGFDGIAHDNEFLLLAAA